MFLKLRSFCGFIAVFMKKKRFFFFYGPRIKFLTKARAMFACRTEN